MILVYEDLIQLFGVAGLKRLVHLESPENDSLLKSRIENWLSISEKMIFGLVGLSEEIAPQYVLDAVANIVLALLRYNLIPSEPNRLQYELLSNQLIKLVESKRKLDPFLNPIAIGDELRGVHIFVV